jgi:hypothetical protein
MTFGLQQVGRPGRSERSANSQQDTVPARLALRDLVARYRRAEDGALMVFSLYIFVIMVMVAGLAVDMMWFESRRATLQATLDRAILAAADLNQTLDPEAVVEDYFTKAGLRDFLIDVDVDQGLNYRSVTALAATEFPTFFMHWTGVKELRAPALGTALERITEVEVSMVLDVSGSMNWTNKLDNMKGATEVFFNMLFADPDEENISVSVVPYATQVSAGPLLLDHYNYQRWHNFSHCVDFPATAFSTPALTTATSLPQSGHFDPFTSWNQNDLIWEHVVCPTSPTREIIPFSSNPGDLQDYVDALVAGGATSIDLGTKWGAALLDPSARPVVSSLIADGHVSPAFDGRPFDYGEENVMKVLILMTDGENTQTPFINSNRTTQLSGVWRWQSATNPSDVRWSVDSPEGSGIDRDGDGRTNERYFHPTNTGTARWTNSIIGGTTGSNPAVQLTYQQIWAMMPVRKWAYDFYYRQRNSSTDYNNALNSVFTQITNNSPTFAKDVRLQQVCSAAKNQGIIIFAIGFEVEDRSAGVMRDCASSPNHFFRVANTEIYDAFRSIASTINRLRLTQ